jgi:hypothetical protein
LVKESRQKSWAGHLKGIPPTGGRRFLKTHSERCSKEQRSAAYHRAAAARARRLRAEATAPWMKGHLENAIDEHEQIAEEIERISEPRRRCGGVTTRNLRAFKRNPRPIIRGLHQIPFGTTGHSGLSAGDYSNPRLQCTTFDLRLMLKGSPQAQSLSQLTGTRVNPYREARIQRITWPR